MDLSTISFSEFEIAQVQGLLRAFINMESDHKFVDGQFTLTPKRLTSAFIAEHFGCEGQKADRLLSELIDGAFLDAHRLAPLSKGMALANEKSLPRISRNEADRIIKDLVAAAEQANSRPGARVFVASLDIFGSYVSGKPDLGDVDVLATIEIPDDCQPEDFDERDEVAEMLQVSEYVSLTDELDQVALSAQKTRVFNRIH